MVDFYDIVQAVAGKLAKGFPESPVYVDDVPKNFTRPSFLVELLDIKAAAHTRWTEALTVSVRVSAFAPMDAHGNAKQAEVMALLQKARACIAYELPVGDRVLYVAPAAVKPAYADGFFTLTITYADDYGELEQYPTMEHIKTKIEQQEDL